MKTLYIAVASFVLSFLAGCTSEFDHLDFASRTSPPEAVTIDYRSIEIPAGIAIGVTATPMASDRELDEETVVTLESADPTILGVDPSLEARTFVVYGVGHGNTTVNVVIDGRLQGIIPAIVQPQ